MHRASLALLLTGCGASLPTVVAPGDVEDATGPPSLRSVTDLGGRASRLPGPLGGDVPGDGIAAVGELLLLSGDNLGRLPTVTIGRRPAEIEAFTDGGIVVRVPPRTPTGEQSIVVEHSRGRAERRVVIRRWAVVLADGMAHLVAIDRTGPRLATRVPAPRGRQVRFSSDASVALVLGERLTVVDVAAQQGPRVVAVRDLPMAADHLAVARGPGASRAALLGRDGIVMIDASDPQRPAFWSKRTLSLPTEAAAAEMDDAGKELALLHGNRVSFVDLSDVAAPVTGAPVDVASAVAPLGTHLRYSGGAVWALLGGNARSAATGLHPVRLVRVRDGAVDATIDVAPAGDAAGLALAETRRVSGSTIHASAMMPLFVACNAGQRGAVLRVDGSGAVPVLDAPEPILGMDAGGGTAYGVACRQGRLTVLASGSALALDAPCPSTQPAVAVQP